MKILVYDIAAETAGALVILQEYYKNACKDKKNYYFFVVSKAHLDNQDNITILKYSWVKNNRLNRIIFDSICIQKILKQYGIEKIISLQNILVSGTKIEQDLYLHQALPFSEFQYKIYKNFKLWIYQKVIGYLIKKSVKKANRIIVQTDWMKDQCLKILGKQMTEIHVIKPFLKNCIDAKFIDVSDNRHHFFYPAAAADYKNHIVIIKACQFLQRSGINNYQVTFSISGNENRLSKKLKKEAEKSNLPINFSGAMEREKVLLLYQSSVLIFPSRIESLGLPLMEAREAGTYILAADLPYSHDVLNGYEKVYYFPSTDFNELSKKMRKIMDKAD